MYRGRSAPRTDVEPDQVAKDLVAKAQQLSADLGVPLFAKEIDDFQKLGCTLLDHSVTLQSHGGPAP